MNPPPMYTSTRQADNVESRNFMVLNVGYAETTHNWGYTDLSSPITRVLYIVEGSAILHLPWADVECRPGYMYLVPTFVRHSYECGPGFKFYYLFFFERFREKTDIFDEREFPVETRANEAADLLFRNYCQLYPNLSLPYKDAAAFDAHKSYKQYAEDYANMESFEHLQLQGLVWIVFSYFMKHSRPKLEVADERVLRIAGYVQQHIAEEISIEQLADIGCVSKPHLNRLFSKAFGLSPLRYVNRKKIVHAQKLLLTTGLSVQQVAMRVGFEDPSYFIRLFKKHVGFTPQDYRVKLK